GSRAAASCGSTCCPRRPAGGAWACGRCGATRGGGGAGGSRRFPRDVGASGAAAVSRPEVAGGPAGQGDGDPDDERQGGGHGPDRGGLLAGRCPTPPQPELEKRSSGRPSIHRCLFLPGGSPVIAEPTHSKASTWTLT